jgi:hypothetical protein
MGDKGETYGELRAHVVEWRKRKGKGFNANPLGELEEKVRWLCKCFDDAKPAARKAKVKK